MFRPAESALIEIRVRIGLEICSNFVQERQQCIETFGFRKSVRVAPRRQIGFSQNFPRVFEIRRNGLRREAGVRANLFEKIFFLFKIFA